MAKAKKELHASEVTLLKGSPLNVRVGGAGDAALVKHDDQHAAQAEDQGRRQPVRRSAVVSEIPLPSGSEGRGEGRSQEPRRPEVEPLSRQVDRVVLRIQHPSCHRRLRLRDRPDAQPCGADGGGVAGLLGESKTCSMLLWFLGFFHARRKLPTV